MLHRIPRPLSTLALALSLSGPLVLAPTFAFADGVGVDVATPDQKLEAKTAFEAAVKLFEKESWSAALAGFTKSHDVVASPNASFMMARCLDKLDKPAEAYNALVRIDGEAKGIDKYKQTQQQAADLRGELAKKVGVLKLSVVSPGGGQVAVSIQGAPVSPGVDHAVMPGPFEVVATTDGKPAKTEQGTVAAGETKPLVLDLTPAVVTPPPKPVDPALPPQPTPDPVLPLPPVKKGGSGGTGYFVGAVVLGAVGVAGFAVGIPFGVFAQNDKDELDASCPNFKCNISQGALDDQKSSIDQESLIATVGFVVGGVASAGAITLAIVGATRPKHADQPSVGVLIGPGSVGVAGSF